MTVIALTEAGPVVEHRLSAGQALALTRSRLVEVRPGRGPDRWRLRADRYVGAARVGDLEVWIAPKLPVDRLLFLVGYATSGRRWRDEELPMVPHPDLVAVVAEALCRQVTRAVRPGLLQGYRVVDATSSVLRGRLREADQLHRHRGQPWPLEIRHDEFTVDIAENRLLKAAVARMGRVPRLPPAARQRLRRLAARFDPVGSLPPGAPLPAWQPTRLNARYQPALRLAELVLRDSSVELSTGDVPVTGLVLNMYQVFEDFVSRALAEAVEPTYGGRIVPQSRCHLDLAGRVTLRPDLVWRHQQRVRAVLDVKYKAEQSSGYPQEDLYQLLAYCTALGLDRGHLVYAAGDAQPLVHTVRNAGIDLVCHALDLAAPPDGLLAQVRRLGTQLAGVPDRLPRFDVPLTT